MSLILFSIEPTHPSWKQYRSRLLIFIALNNDPLRCGVRIRTHTCRCVCVCVCEREREREKERESEREREREREDFRIALSTILSLLCKL